MLLAKMEQHRPQQTAVITPQGRTLSYGALLTAAGSWGSHLRPRTLVFCLCSNTIGSIEGYLGCYAADAVPLLLDGTLEDSLLLELVAHYQPAFLFLPAARAGLFASCPLLAENEEYCLLSHPAPAYPIHPDLALLLTTSGSTGSPKLVRQSMENICANAAAIAEYLELDATERPISTLPMHYTYGLSILHSHFWVGAAVLLTGASVMQQEFWDFFGAANATSLAGVPVTYDLLARAGFFERSLPSLRTFTQAGGKLSLQMHENCARYAQKIGAHFYAMYGQAEATARMSYLPWQMALQKCGSVGIAIPGGSFSLEAVDGTEILAADQDGELIYRGKNVTLGYAETIADLALGDERHGLLRTGDIARRDEDGYYYITGRMKRFLKLAGSRVNLDACEQILRRAFPAIDCACCGTDEHLRVFAAGEACPEEIRQHLTELLHLRPASVTVRQIEEIPRNSAGKVLYPPLEALPL